MKPKTEKWGLLKAVIGFVAFLVRAVVGLVKAVVGLVAFLVRIGIILAVAALVIALVIKFSDSDSPSPITPIIKPAETPITKPAECVIKGNISHNSGRKIYHLPGMEYYEQTRIDPSRGERWFCTESEAINNGWRKALR